MKRRAASGADWRKRDRNRKRDFREQARRVTRHAARHNRPARLIRPSNRPRGTLKPRPRI
jgi:hypothetical protein